MAGRQAAGATTEFLARAVALAGGRRVIVAVGTYTACINLLALTGPAYMLVLYGHVVPSGSRGELVAATVVMVALYLTGAAAETARQNLVRKSAQRLERPLRARARSLSPAHAHELGVIRNFLQGPAPTAFCDVPFVPLYVACLLLLHPMFCVLAVVGAACLAAPLNAAETQAPGRNPPHPFSIDVARRALRPTLPSLMLGLGAYLMMSGACHAGSAFAAAIILQRMLGPVEALLVHWPSAKAARASAHRLLHASHAHAPCAHAQPREIRIVLRRSGDYARSATRGGATSASSDLRPTAQ